MSIDTGPSAPTQMLDVQRQLFDMPETVTYLNCANMSPQLRTVTAAGVAAVNHKAAPWTLRSEDWFAPAERLRALFAAVINADADGIALVPSVSYGITLAAANLEVRRGQSIVLLEGECPSNVYAWQELARQRGAVIRTVRREATGTWTDSVLDAIRSDTAVVSLPNCHWTDGRLVDLARVASAARSAGAALVVDASQSAGAYPLDVSMIRPDFLVTVGYKWLLGPYGLGYLYFAPRSTSEVPGRRHFRGTGWQDHGALGGGRHRTAHATRHSQRRVNGPAKRRRCAGSSFDEHADNAFGPSPGPHSPSCTTCAIRSCSRPRTTSRIRHSV